MAALPGLAIFMKLEILSCKYALIDKVSIIGL